MHAGVLVVTAGTFRILLWFATAEHAGTSSSVIFGIFCTSRGRHAIFDCDWSSDVCSSDLSAIAPKTGDIVATVELEDTPPEGAAADGKGHIFVNNESKHTIQVIDVKTWKATASWPLAPCEGPTGIAYDKASNRIFSGCNKTSVVLDASTGKVVASITNGTRVDALGWDPSRKLIFIPNGGEGNVTVVHQDSADKYTVVATVNTFVGAKTIAVDPKTHNAYLFQPERGPAPAPAEGAPPPAAAPGGRGRGPQGPIVAAWFIVIRS